ncbi:MAG: hydrogenase maturation protease [Gemmatimonadales bacterium]|nr:hydrogenase maturation protease [Gemmatimonadales bacterium]
MARGAPRILVAGIGNVFLGDDGFGVVVAQALVERRWPPGVTVREFGIRGIDLAYALQNGYDAAILIDAMPRGEAPGTLFVLEPELDDAAPPTVETHGMDPVRVLHLVRGLGGEPPRTLVVGCEPEQFPEDHDPTAIITRLSAPVQTAVAGAVRLVEKLVQDLTAGEWPASPSNESAR